MDCKCVADGGGGDFDGGGELFVGGGGLDFGVLAVVDTSVECGVVKLGG